MRETYFIPIATTVLRTFLNVTLYAHCLIYFHLFSHSSFTICAFQRCVIYACIHRLYTDTYVVYMLSHTHTHKYVYIHTYIRTCMHTYIHTYVRIHTYIHKYIRTYIHIYIHTYIHTYINTYTRT